MKQTNSDNNIYSKFITNEEWTESTALQREFERLQACFESVKSPALVSRYKEATSKFLADPTDSNFAVLIQAERDRVYYAENTRVRGIVREVRDRFFIERIAPWARPILSRAIEALRTKVEEIKQRENARCIELTGLPLTKSDVVEHAQFPLDQLEGTLDLLEKTKSLATAFCPNFFLPFVAGILDPTVKRERLKQLVVDAKDDGEFPAEEEGIISLVETPS